ncbi:hypothetical protein EDD29_0085 [Actinocorallia herbida]|uniref:Uncharacterized protein n=1 Tax=Actinocorallia herbida TaxID=58109 RepID=A0A3N1CN78_9ACTN|nr:hypothetical protein [Actinocorallia herbida]ROO82604.1 hypothetical protein EDD29_0085 [Actinocorallia herbida]
MDDQSIEKLVGYLVLLFDSIRHALTKHLPLPIEIDDVQQGDTVQVMASLNRARTLMVEMGTPDLPGKVLGGCIVRWIAAMEAVALADMAGDDGFRLDIAEALINEVASGLAVFMQMMPCENEDDEDGS